MVRSNLKRSFQAMARGRCNFRQRDVEAAFRAAKAVGGVDIAAIQVRLEFVKVPAATPEDEAAPSPARQT